MKAYAFDLEGFAAQHLGGNVEKLADQVASNHRTKPCQIAEQNRAKSPNDPMSNHRMLLTGAGKMG